MSESSVGIIGAGPAGIMAALEATRHGAQVTLFDTNAAVGRKIHVTGNGRCNISNVHVAAERYTCADQKFLETAFGLYGHEMTIARLRELCIPTYSTPDGWCYPLSDSAAMVADALATMLDLAGVDVQLQRKVVDIRRSARGFALTIGGPSHVCEVDRLAVACGGKAYPALGSTGELFPVLGKLGHTIAPIYPALVPITGQMKQFHKLQGVRLDVGLSLWEGSRKLGETTGNLMFAQDGFSGPAAMDLSHLVSTRPGATLRLVIDLAALHRDELMGLIARMRRQPAPLRVVLGAVMPAKLPPVVMPMAGLDPEVKLSEVSQKELNRLLHLISHLEADVTGTRGFKFAQLSTGGIPVTEIDPRTMESRIVPGLHFAGEVVDVIGPCGGFNLQWCWTSGALAGHGLAY